MCKNERVFSSLVASITGEDESHIRARLLKLEIEQPDMKEGWKNELQSAMRDVDEELVKVYKINIQEVIEGSSDDPNKHDVDLSSSFNDNWEKIEEQATLLGIGKLQASIHKQTVMNLKPLLNSLENHSCNNDIRHHLTNICRLLIIDRNYILANNAYMTMAIGNAPWPVGVTRSGIHQRPGSAKAYVSNIAHVLNDETQRKYIQSFKRLMTRMQEYFPTDPSKCVEYVRSQ
ncbi:Prp18 domain protein [Ancylostoma ceylanicum]|uniref:Pre-mRNA-splicing factor 18 n=1 Tax=Ancylostoma ceylanicum TaxID=53326 RepID=A0A0D6LNE4_9BILA|nr:Prp18 domain protein [Ancylostoma ceylanicum]